MAPDRWATVRGPELAGEALGDHLGGNVIYRGRSLVGERPDRILGFGLAYIPQGRLVFTQMTVRENLEMGAYLERDRADWVLKLDLSRVGEHVLVGSLVSDKDWRTALDEISMTRDLEVWLAQRFVAQRPISTPLGPRCITLGAYVLDGSFCGYFARLSPVSHCSHDALVLPVFVETA